MFEPTIVVNTTDAIWDSLSTRFSSYAPQFIKNTFEIGNKERIPMRPKIIRTDRPSDLDNSEKAPNLLIFIFDSPTMDEFKSKDQARIRNWTHQNLRNFIPFLPIFYNDPKKAKAKAFFGISSSYLNYLQKEYPSLQTVLVKNDGDPKGKDLSKVWDTINDMITRGLKVRMDIIRDRIVRMPPVDSFRNQIILCNLYGQLTFHQQAIETMENTRSILKIFQKDTFMNESHLHYPLVPGIDSSGVENLIKTSNPMSYDIYYLITVKISRSQTLLGDVRAASNTIWAALIEISEKMLNTHIFPETVVETWVCKNLQDLISYLSQEVPQHRKEIGQHLTAAIEWYTQILTSLFQKERVSFQDERSVVRFQSISEILSSLENYRSEQRKRLTEVRDLSLRADHKRTTANILEKLSTFDDQNKLFHSAAIIKTAAIGGFQYIPRPTSLEALSSIPGTGEKIITCCSILAHHDKLNSQIALEVLNSIISEKGTKYASVQYQLPIALEYIQSSVFVSENHQFSFSVKSEIDGPLHPLHTNMILLGPDNLESTLSGDSVTIFDRDITLEGNLKSEGFYRPMRLEFIAGAVTLRVPMTNVDWAIDVKAKPPPFKIDVEIPAFLLPDTFQHALVKINNVSVLNSLSLKVNGITATPAPIRLSDGNELKPKIGMVYENLPVGEHTMYLPVKAISSGTFRIEAIENEHIVTKEVPYKVSEFLSMSIMYRGDTQAAQLMIESNTVCNIVVEKVEFRTVQDKVMESESIGVPLNVDVVQSFALFKLKEAPDSAVVTLRQIGMSSFDLRFKVGLFEGKLVRTNFSSALTPFTPIVPLKFTI